MAPSTFDIGLLIGILVAQGHFGGDGRQPHITLRLHTDHELIFRWLDRTFPGGRLYGPYHHAGRHYYQWMARGTFLRHVLVPILDEYLTSDLDTPAWTRYQAMKTRYAASLRPEGGTSVGREPARPGNPYEPGASRS